jgi:hypothetical protein
MKLHRSMIGGIVTIDVANGVVGFLARREQP